MGEPATLEYIYPTRVDAVDTLRLQGTLVEKSRTELVTVCSAQVQRVFVSAGSTVVKGQLLACLQPTSDKGTEQSELLHQLVSGLDLSALYSGSGQKSQVSYQGTPGTDMIYLYAPTDGVILESDLVQGNRVPAYGTCVVLADTGEMRISAKVSEDTVALLRTGLSCTADVEALGIYGAAGWLEQIAPYATQTAALGQTAETTTQITILLEEPTGLQPGYTASVRFVVEEYKDMLLVPYACVGQDQNGEYVMAVEGDRIVKLPVTTGKELAEGIQIRSGIQETTRVLAVPAAENDGKAICLT